MPPQFMIGGSPRSGTTLAQRLCCELDDVTVPPETLFLSTLARHVPPGTNGGRPADWAPFLDDLLRRTRPAADPTVARQRILGRAGTEATPLDVLDVLIHDGTDAAVVGEKTPQHLLWFRHLAERWPTTRFVVVIRDPRSVVASMQRAPFGMDSAAALAAVWADDVREARWLRTTLPDRVHLVKFEDLVVAPDRGRAGLARFLGVAPRVVALTADLYVPREQGWKWRAVQAIDPDRSKAWADELTVADQRTVAAIAGRAARRLGYDVPRRAPSPPDAVRAAMTHAHRRRSLARIAEIAGSWA